MHGISTSESSHQPQPAGPDQSPVTLVKGGHRWVFACAPGEEATLLSCLAELARCRDTPFDWFDAALVSHQLRKRLNAGLHRIDATPAGVAGTPPLPACGGPLSAPLKPKG